MFIKQIFFGILEKKEILKSVTDSLFKSKPSSTERKDELLFQIFVYMTLFRLNELSLDDYKSLVLVSYNLLIFQKIKKKKKKIFRLKIM